MRDRRHSSRRRRDPRLLQGALARVKGDLAPPGLLAAVQERWEDAVGGTVSEQALPVIERDGTITVQCRSAGWTSELTLLSETLLDQLNSRLEGGLSVRALKFTTRPS